MLLFYLNLPTHHHLVIDTSLYDLATMSIISSHAITKSTSTLFEYLLISETHALGFQT